MSTEFKTVDCQLEEIQRGISEIIPLDELKLKLENSYKSKLPLNIKLGCDPSRPDLHLGHTVVLRKLKQFQDLGHQIIFIIGDFTGMIGDPSGRSKTRPALSFDEVREFGKSYFEQASKVINIHKAKIHYNSEWLAKMSFEDVIKLASKYTVARILERDDFTKRYKNEEPIGIHEFLYPLAQAMDSVAIKADVEIGGTDQKFNLLVGRYIQREFGLEPQCILTMPILPGTDGMEKMSKSLDNYIGISEKPNDIYGKVLSIPDNLIYKYFELATDLPTQELKEIKLQLENPQTNPRDIKRQLARKVVEMYYDKKTSQAAEENFDKIFIKKENPENIEEFEITNSNEISILKLLIELNVVKSNSEARTLVLQGGISINNEKILDFKQNHRINDGDILKVGKRKFFRLKINKEK